MTREEAIRWLTNEKWTNANNKYKKEWNEAFDMAIEALRTIDNCDQCEWCCPSDGIPTIHVLRCKDCKYWNSETKGCKRNPSVEAWYESDFCNYGERKESE